MTERTFTVSALHVFATVFWVLGAALILVDLFTRISVGQLGLFATGVAIVAHIKGLLWGLEERERNAFELGRDRERVTPIR